MNKILITTKIKLVSPEKSDAKDLYQLRTNPSVNKFVIRKLPKTIHDVEDFIEQRNSDERDYYFVIKKLPNLELIGAICLKDIDTAGKYAEVGYELFPNFQGKGLMTNALTEILKFAFKELNLETIEAYTHADNSNSKKLLERFNFKLLVGKVDSDNPNNIVYCLKKTSL